MRSPDLFELLAPPGTRMPKVNHIPSTPLKMSIPPSKKKDDERPFTKKYFILQSCATSAPPSMSVTYHPGGRLVTADIRLEYNPHNYTPHTAIKDVLVKLNHFTHVHPRLRTITENTCREEVDIVRRDFYRGIIRDVYFRNGCPFVPHPELLTHLKEWEKEHCLNYDVVANARDIIHATEQIGLNNQLTDQLKAEAAAKSLPFPTDPAAVEDPVPRIYLNDGNTFPPLPTVDHPRHATHAERLITTGQQAISNNKRDVVPKQAPTEQEKSNPPVSDDDPDAIVLTVQPDDIIDGPESDPTPTHGNPPNNINAQGDIVTPTHMDTSEFRMIAPSHPQQTVTVTSQPAPIIASNSQFMSSIPLPIVPMPMTQGPHLHVQQPYYTAAYPTAVEQGYQAPIDARTIIQHRTAATMGDARRIIDDRQNAYPVDARVVIENKRQLQQPAPMQHSGEQHKPPIPSVASAFSPSSDEALANMIRAHIQATAPGTEPTTEAIAALVNKAARIA